VFAAFGMRGVEIMFRTSTLFSKVDVQATALYNDYYSAMSNITFPPEELPQTGEQMKALMDAQSRWLNPQD
jgi:hypothetical protein